MVERYIEKNIMLLFVPNRSKNLLDKLIKKFENKIQLFIQISGEDSPRLEIYYDT